MKPVHTKMLVVSGLVWGCSFAILAAAYMCLVFPQAKAERDINAKLSERKEVHQRYKLANSEKSRKQRREQIAMLDDKLTRFVADEIAVDSLPFDIATIAEKAKLIDFSSNSRSMVDESFLEIQNCGYIGYTLFDLSFTSSFDNFAAFVNTLEQHVPVIFIDEFSIARNSEKPDENKTRLGLSIFIHSPQGLNANDDTDDNINDYNFIK